MKVSVIILNYNGKDFIQDCVDSVLQSSYKKIEIIILDNASSDNSYQLLVKKYGNKTKVKLYRSDKQLYFTGGCNFAAKKTTGELLFFLNSDTTIEKNCIKHLVKFIGKNNKILVQPKILFYDKPNIIDNVGGYYDMFGIGHAQGRDQLDYEQYNSPRHVDYVNGTAFVIAKILFDQLGGFINNYRYYYEDVDLSLRARKVKALCWTYPAAIVYHKNSLTFKSNVSIVIRKYYYLKNRLVTAIRHKSIYTIPLLLPIWTFVYFISHFPNIGQLRLTELKHYINTTKFNLLDLGTGNGRFIQICHAHGVDAIGIDKNTANQQHIINSTIEQLKVSQKFNFVTMYHVLEHTTYPNKVLQKVNSLLKDNGILVLEIPLVGNLTEKLLGKDYFAYHDKTHKHFFTKQAIYKLITKSRFNIVGKGFTLYMFPATVITTSMRQGRTRAIVGCILFIPLKLLSIFGYNDEIIRLYCKKN